VGVRGLAQLTNNLKVGNHAPQQRAPIRGPHFESFRLPGRELARPIPKGRLAGSYRPRYEEARSAGVSCVVVERFRPFTGTVFIV
jgi:hypothetical protein